MPNVRGHIWYFDQMCPNLIHGYQIKIQKYNTLKEYVQLQHSSTVLSAEVQKLSE